MAPRPEQWRPEFLGSATETAELAAELHELTEGVSAQAQAVGDHTSRTGARIESLREWANQLDARPKGGVL